MIHDVPKHCWVHFSVYAVKCLKFSLDLNQLKLVSVANTITFGKDYWTKDTINAGKCLDNFKLFLFNTTAIFFSYKAVYSGPTTPHGTKIISENGELATITVNQTKPNLFYCEIDVAIDLLCPIAGRLVRTICNDSTDVSSYYPQLTMLWKKLFFSWHFVWSFEKQIIISFQTYRPCFLFIFLFFAETEVLCSVTQSCIQNSLLWLC